MSSIEYSPEKLSSTLHCGPLYAQLSGMFTYHFGFSVGRCPAYTELIKESGYNLRSPFNTCALIPDLTNSTINMQINFFI